MRFEKIYESRRPPISIYYNSRFLDDKSVSLRLATVLNFNISKVAYWPLAMKRRLRSISESVLSKTSDIPTLSIMCNLLHGLVLIFSQGAKDLSGTLAQQRYTVISRKVVWKNVHSTIPKGNNIMGYDQYTFPNDCSCRTYFGFFPLAIANITSQTSLTILSNFFEEQCTQTHPQYLSGLSRAHFPTSFLKIAVYRCDCRCRCGSVSSAYLFFMT